jgi:hypothetical protein
VGRRQHWMERRSEQLFAEHPALSEGPRSLEGSIRNRRVVPELRATTASSTAPVLPVVTKG